jgi:putative NIF3 family GTP cyclohydrolase 1 type 2
MIIAYHPPIFKPLSALTLANPLQASLLRCAAAGISVYSPHTALDAVWGGINDWLADGLVEASNNSATVGTLKGALDPNWQLEGGEGRVVEFDSGMEMRKVEEIIKKHLGVSQRAPTRSRSRSPFSPTDFGASTAFLVQSAYGKSGPVKTIAICAGSGGSMLLGYEADVYWTGEMSHVSAILLA